MNTDAIIELATVMLTGGVLALVNAADPSTGQMICEDYLGGHYRIVEMKPDPGDEGVCKAPIGAFRDVVDTRQ